MRGLALSVLLLCPGGRGEGLPLLRKWLIQCHRADSSGYSGFQHCTSPLPLPLGGCLGGWLAGGCTAGWAVGWPVTTVAEIRKGGGQTEIPCVDPQRKGKALGVCGPRYTNKSAENHINPLEMGCSVKHSVAGQGPAQPSHYNRRTNMALFMLGHTNCGHKNDDQTGSPC